MKFEIKHKVTEKVLFSAEAENFKMAVEKAIKEVADLKSADLKWANLRDAYLKGANLRGASIKNADLRGSNLRDADLRDVDLRGSNLRGADLRGTNLEWANLRDADLRDTNLRDTDLRGIKEYVDSHDILFELIRREPVETFSTREWEIIKQISKNRPCWGEIEEVFGDKIISGLQFFADKGFNEYLKKYMLTLNE